MLCLCLWTLAQEASGVDSLSSSTRIQAQQQEQPRVSSLFLPSSLELISSPVSMDKHRNNSPALLQWNMKPSLVPQCLQALTSWNILWREKMRSSASMKMCQRFPPFSPRDGLWGAAGAFQRQTWLQRQLKPNITCFRNRDVVVSCVCYSVVHEGGNVEIAFGFQYCELLISQGFISGTNNCRITKRCIMFAQLKQPYFRRAEREK